jgi:putative membrane protein insertion efficiency factor
MGFKMRDLRWIGHAIAWGAIKLIRFYQLVLSPMKYALFGPNSGCRYRPTCSSYSIECFQTLSLGKAFYYSGKRILSCHPWGGSGYDPVPDSNPENRR